MKEQELTGLTIVDDKTLTITLKEAADPAYVKRKYRL